MNYLAGFRIYKYITQIYRYEFNKIYIIIWLLITIYVTIVAFTYDAIRKKEKKEKGKVLYRVETFLTYSYYES
jgi:hypothetical protein